MAGELLTCPFCGFGFAAADTLCAHGCPLRPACGLVRCPNCQYEYADRPRGAGVLARWLGRRVEPPAVRGTVVRAVELDRGERAVVRCVSGQPSRRNALAAFGLVPGAEVRVIQQRPECVLRVGETDLALERAIAGGVLVERGAPPRPDGPPAGAPAGRADKA